MLYAYIAFVLLVFVLSFSALLLRTRAVKFVQVIILPVICLAVCPWLTLVVNVAFYVFAEHMRGYFYQGVSIADYILNLLLFLVVVIFGVLAHRKKDVLLRTTAIVLTAVFLIVLVMNSISLIRGANNRPPHRDPDQTMGGDEYDTGSGDGSGERYYGLH